MSQNYYAPQGGHPKQTELLTGRAVFTNSYAVIPKGVMNDIVTSPPAPLLDSCFASLGEGRQIATLEILFGLRALPQF